MKYTIFYLAQTPIILLRICEELQYNLCHCLFCGGGGASRAAGPFLSPKCVRGWALECTLCAAGGDFGRADFPLLTSSRVLPFSECCARFTIQLYI